MPYTSQSPIPFTSVSSPVLLGSAGAALTGAPFLTDQGRKTAYIQVVGSGSPLYVNYGSSPAGTGNFHVILKPSTSIFGGDGGVLVETQWKGDISISGSPLCYASVWAGY